MRNDLTNSGRAPPNFLGAFEGALPGHDRYQHRMYRYFMYNGPPPERQGEFLANDDVSWTPGWVEGMWSFSRAFSNIWCWHGLTKMPQDYRMNQSNFSVNFHALDLV